MSKSPERTMNESMPVEEQLSKIDEYINWVKSLSYEQMQKLQEFYFMYQSEYVQSLEVKKWLISEGHGLTDRERKILNGIEKLMKSI